MTCVSGSPNLALNSITFGPSEVAINPAYNTPINGRPISLIPLAAGFITFSIPASMIASEI